MSLGVPNINTEDLNQKCGNTSILQELVIDLRINWLRLLTVQWLSVSLILSHFTTTSMKHAHEWINDVEFLHNILNLRVLLLNCLLVDDVVNREYVSHYLLKDHFHQNLELAYKLIQEDLLHLRFCKAKHYLGEHKSRFHHFWRGTLFLALSHQ